MMENIGNGTENMRKLKSIGDAQQIYDARRGGFESSIRTKDCKRDGLNEWKKCSRNNTQLKQKRTAS